MTSALTVGVEPGVEPNVGTSVSSSKMMVGRGVTVMRGDEVGAHVHRSTTCSVGLSVFSAPRDRRGLDGPFRDLPDLPDRADESQRSRSVIAKVSPHPWGEKELVGG